MPQNTVDGKTYYGCTCPRCRKMFEEKYGRPMPEFSDADAAAFGTDSIVDYFREMTEYSASKGMKNVVCVMLGTYGMSLDVVDRVCSLPHMDNIGSDPYWVGAKEKDPALNVYDFVSRGTKENLRVSEQFHKDHNIWIQTYNNPRGAEEDIVVATEAAYDAGARTIIAWGYYGSESNDYAAKNAPVTWAKTCEAMQRVRNFERDRILAENRKLYMKLSPGARPVPKHPFAAHLHGKRVFSFSPIQNRMLRIFSAIAQKLNMAGSPAASSQRLS